MAAISLTPPLELAQAYLSGMSLCDLIDDEEDGEAAYEMASSAWDALTLAPVTSRQDALGKLVGLRRRLLVCLGEETSEIALLDQVAVYLRGDA